MKWLQQATKDLTVGQISNLGQPKYGAGVLFTRQVRSVVFIIMVANVFTIILVRNLV